MGKIICLMGKSATGKDTIYKRLLGDDGLQLQRIVPYTTRPIRVKEQEGVEYHFTDEAGYMRFREAGSIVEDRAYQTVHGIWRYFTVDDGNIDLQNHSYLLIGTLEAYVKIRDYFGASQVIPILIEVEDGERLSRALQRERKQENPKYEELCRRFLADSADFSRENQLAAGIDTVYMNSDLDQCLQEIRTQLELVLAD